MKLDKYNMHILRAGDSIEIDSRWFTGVTQVQNIAYENGSYVMYIKQGFGYTPGMFDGEDRIKSLTLLSQPSPEEIKEEENYYKDLLEL